MKYLNQIKKEAAKRNITLKQLADSLNTTEDVLKKAFKSGSLSLDQLNKICERLNIEMSDIFSKNSHVDFKPKKQSYFSNKLFC